jgi:hypothetical protein
MPAHEYDEHVTIDHQLLVNLGDPAGIGWKEDGRRREGVLARGALCIQSDSDANAPRWHGTMTFATAAIPPSMVDALLLDHGPRPASTFAKRHCVSDGMAHRFVRSLSTELTSPTEPLYVEVLSQAFVLHLLGTHGQAPGRNSLRRREGSARRSSAKRSSKNLQTRFGSPSQDASRWSPPAARN